MEVKDFIFKSTNVILYYNF